jgi:uroporphyrinogen decarboxylase
MIEGGSSRDFPRARAFAHAEPAAFERLRERTGDALVPYLREQARAGAHVLQLFDTWGAILPPALHERFVLRPAGRVIEALGSDRPPMVYFPGLGSEARIEEAAGIGAEALSLDWTTDLRRAYERVGDRVRLQGNLDPAALLGPEAEVGPRVERMLARVPPGRTHVVNLGHGVLKETPPENVHAFVRAAQRFRPVVGAAR